MGPTSVRLAAIASERFDALRIPSNMRRLTITLVGFQQEGHERPRGYCYRISNFQGPELDSPPRMEADAIFSSEYYRETLPLPDTPALVIPSLDESVMTSADVDFLADALKQGHSADVLVQRAVTLIRRVGDRPKARRLIGRDCISLVIPREQSIEARGDYYPDGASARIHLPNYVKALGDGLGDLEIRGFTAMSLGDEGEPIMEVPKVGRNKPCPCGSGMKYKKCHGAH